MKTLLTVALLTLTTTAAAQTFAPFGISFTATADDLRRMGGKLGSDGTWDIPNPPQTNPEFDNYRVNVTPKGRICSIYGSGRTLTTTGDGAAVKTQFSKLKAVLQSKYGPSYDEDELDRDSIYTGKNDWMTAINKNERTLTSWWTPEDKSNMPVGVSAIYISALALDSTRGWVSVFYRTTDYDNCKKERNTLPGTGL